MKQTRTTRTWKTSRVCVRDEHDSPLHRHDQQEVSRRVVLSSALGTNCWNDTQAIRVIGKELAEAGQSDDAGAAAYISAPTHIQSRFRSLPIPLDIVYYSRFIRFYATIPAGLLTRTSSHAPWIIHHSHGAGRCLDHDRFPIKAHRSTFNRWRRQSWPLTSRWLSAAINALFKSCRIVVRNVICTHLASFHVCHRISPSVIALSRFFSSALWNCCKSHIHLSRSGSFTVPYPSFRPAKRLWVGTNWNIGMILRYVQSTGGRNHRRTVRHHDSIPSSLNCSKKLKLWVANDSTQRQANFFIYSSNNVFSWIKIQSADTCIKC